jgi:HSP20 family protein
MTIVRREEDLPEPTEELTHYRSETAHTGHHQHHHHHHPSGSEAEVGRYPPVNISATDTQIIVRAELCIENIDDLNLAIAGNSLILQGTRETSPDMEGAVYHRRERGYGSFHRAVALPVAVEEKGIDATYHDGVLTVILPKSEVERPRQITVKPIEKRS